MLGKHEFVRGHGLGNDYLVVDGERFGIELTPARIVAICDRHTGVGSDGILERVPTPAGFDAAVRIYNPDGSEAEKSGNGTRIFAKFCFDHGYAPADVPLRMHTLGGPVTAQLVARERDRTRPAHVDGPRSSVAPTAHGRPAPKSGCSARSTVGDRSFRHDLLVGGQPALRALRRALRRGERAQIRPARREPRAGFPQRTNVQLIQPVDRGTVRALIWERGAGWTLASGTSSCAVAAACVRAGLTDRHVKVVMPGGTLEVIVDDDWQLEQIGFAQEVARGTLSADLLHAIDAI